MSKFDKTAVYGRENPFIPSPETMDALKDALIEEADNKVGLYDNQGKEMK